MNNVSKSRPVALRFNLFIDCIDLGPCRKIVLDDGAAGRPKTTKMESCGAKGLAR